jgi:replicative DNA helicase
MTELTQLPHNLDAERAALGCVFLKQSAWAECKGALVPDDLFLPAHREVFEAMQAIDQRQRPPGDPIAVIDELRVRGVLARLPDGEAFVLTLTGAVGHAENLSHYLGIVREKAALRRIIAACAEAGSRARGDAESGDILGDLRRAIGSVELNGKASGTVRIGDVQERAADALEGRFTDPSKHVVSTGLRSLDGVLGGFKPGQQIVIASNPGQGKTSLTWTMLIRAALDRVPCLLFSLEMGLQEMVERAWTLIGEVPGLGYQRPEKPQWDQIRYAMSALADKPLYVNDQKLSLPRLVAEATAWRAKHPDKLALIAVDYLGLVNAKAQGRNREQEVATVSTECKRLAGELQVPLVLVAQLNRENVKGNAGERRRPVMSDLRDSGAVEQDADVIVFPWLNPEDKVMRLIVEKHRNGKTGVVRVDFKRELMGFFDMPYEQDWHDMERSDP